MRKIKRNILLKNMILIFVILLIALVFEVIGFNFRYLSLSEQDKGMTNLTFEENDLHNIDIRDGKYTITDYASEDLPYIIIHKKNISDILSIQIHPDAASMAFEVKVEYPSIGKIDDKDNLVDYNYNNEANIKIESNDSTDIKLILSPYATDNQNQYVIIDNISINNQFNFNVSRFLLIVSCLGIFGLLIINRNLFLKQLHWMFLLITLVFGFNLVFLTPTYFSYDEREHFIKAYQTAALDVGISQETKINWPDVDMNHFFSFNGKSTAFDTDLEKDHYYDLYSVNTYNNYQYYSTTAETYLPTAYIPSAIGIFIGKLLSLPFYVTFYLGRLGNLLFYSTVLALCIKYIKIGKKIIFALGLLPGTLFLASAYSADPVTYVGAIGLVSVFINMLVAKDNTVGWKQLLLFFLCGAVMITGKMTYAPLALLLFIVPYNKFKVIEKSDDKRKRRNIWFLKFLMLMGFGCVVFANLIYSSLNGLAQWPVPGVSVSGQIKFILTHPITYIGICVNFVLNSLPTYFQNPIGDFAYTGTFKSGLTFVAVIVLIILAVVDKEKNENIIFDASGRIMLAVSIILSWGLTITSLYLTFVPVGSLEVLGVQGRYFAPLLLPTLLLLRSGKINVECPEEKQRLILILGSIVLVIFAVLRLFIKYSI